MLKRVLTLSLALVLSASCLGLARAVSEEEGSQPPTAVESPEITAAPTESPEPTPEPPAKLELAQASADQLNELGLFKGTNKGYELESTATRAQAVTMLLRLMGLEVYAQSMPTAHPFTDLPRWCSNAVGYAYNSKLANGVTPTTFAPNDTINARAYLTFLLRALGYGAGDGLTWKNTYEFAAGVGLTETDEYTDDSEFLRADLVLLSHRALELKPKNGQLTLLEKIQARPAFTVLDNGFVNTAGAPDGYEGRSGTFAGQLVDPPAEAPQRPVWDGTETLEELTAELNEFVSAHYSGLYFSQEGILSPEDTRGEVLRLLTDEDGRVGVDVFSWRQGYGSSVKVNQKLNLALEAFLYLSGDGETAYALWSWLDAASIQEGGADTASFGFTDVASTALGGIVELNGHRIELDLSDVDEHIYWFENPNPAQAQPEASEQPE